MYIYMNVYKYLLFFDIIHKYIYIHMTVACLFRSRTHEGIHQATVAEPALLRDIPQARPLAHLLARPPVRRYARAPPAHPPVCPPTRRPPACRLRMRFQSSFCEL